MWLRRGTLEPIIARELGSNGLHGGWNESGRAKCKAFPLGVVGHWPAGNVEIQPILSMTCALLGGNAALVRIPSGLVDLTRQLMEKLVQSDPGEILTRRIFMAAIRAWPAGFAGSHGSSRGRSNDLGRGRGRFADSSVAFSPLGEDWRSLGPGYPSRRWTQGLGAILTNGSPGACASRVMFGNLTSRLVPHPRFCSSKKGWPVDRSISAVSSARL